MKVWYDRDINAYDEGKTGIALSGMLTGID